MIPSPETLGVGFLRKLRLETLKEGITGVTAMLPVEVADYILNKKRREIIELEDRRNLSIAIKGDKAMIPGESNIVCEKQKK